MHQRNTFNGSMNSNVVTFYFMSSAFGTAISHIKRVTVWLGVTMYSGSSSTIQWIILGFEIF